MNHNILKKTELVVREDNTVYGEYDCIDILQLKIDIIKGKIKEQLYFRNQHGGIDKIDEFGCSKYRDFSCVDKLLTKLVRSQMEKRIKKQQ